MNSTQFRIGSSVKVILVGETAPRMVVVRKIDYNAGCIDFVAGNENFWVDFERIIAVVGY